MKTIIPKIDDKRLDVFFRYMGISPEKHLRKTFYLKVKSEDYEKMSNFPYPKHFKGIVVSSETPDRPIGYETNLFCNPFYDFHIYGQNDFQRISESQIPNYKRI